jgi:hypothetical protein
MAFLVLAPQGHWKQRVIAVSGVASSSRPLREPVASLRETIFEAFNQKNLAFFASPFASFARTAFLLREPHKLC